LAKGLRGLSGASKAAISETFGYEYNLDGSLARLHYPSGAIVTYTPDSAGRMLSAVNDRNNIKYVAGATYGPDNALTGFISGSGVRPRTAQIQTSSVIHAGAWSLAFGSPRTHRSTPPFTSLLDSVGASNK
jgi:YD repeat-containing protein